MMVFADYIFDLKAILIFDIYIISECNICKPSHIPTGEIWQNTFVNCFQLCACIHYLPLIKPKHNALEKHFAMCQGGRQDIHEFQKCDRMQMIHKITVVTGLSNWHWDDEKRSPEQSRWCAWPNPAQSEHKYRRATEWILTNHNFLSLFTLAYTSEFVKICDR